MRPKLSKILITGGAGFLGSEVARQAVSCGYSVAIIDKLTYAGDRRRLTDIWHNIAFYKCDVGDADKILSVLKMERPSAIVHCAAETHVDRSLCDERPFIDTNIRGTGVLIKAAKNLRIKRFLHVSTDEVYGEKKQGKSREKDPLRPTNFYAATKAAGEFFVNAAIRAYGFPAIIVRPTNNYGPWQCPEKFIPKIFVRALSDRKFPVYGEGFNIREWLHVNDCARAILLVLEKGDGGETYNIGSGVSCQNINIAQQILDILDKPKTLIKFVKDRPGHDIRYAVENKKILAMGWRPRFTLQEGLKDTALWAEAQYSWLAERMNRLGIRSNKPGCASPG